MRFNRIGLLIVICSAVITLGILTFGESLWQGFTLAKPLEQSLTNIEGIEGISLKKSSQDNLLTIYVTINATDNLQQTYKKIVDIATKNVGKKKFTVVLHDKRTSDLEKFYDDTSYIIQEGIYTGNFSLMLDRLNNKAALQHYDVKVSIDNAYIYLSVSDGKGNLYEVIQR